MGDRNKPNFIGIGAQKCASTWLYDILIDHPQVCLSEQKELDFFSNYYDYGYEWYERNFSARSQSSAIGEVSPSYFHNVSAPERVHAYNPAMQLILFLREPVQRAVSNHKHEVRIGHLTGADLSFERGLANNPLYIEQGLYATHLERWLQYFPREQILVVLFDDVIASGEQVVQTVYEFLGIDKTHNPQSLSERSNESYVNRFGAVERFKNAVRSVIRSVGLSWLWDLIGKLGLQRAYRSVNRVKPDSVIPPMQAATRKDLQARFADEIARLESLAGIDLARWRKE